MSDNRNEIYEKADELKRIIKSLNGRKFMLDCGHRVTFGNWLGNSVTIINRKEPRVICTECSY